MTSDLAAAASTRPMVMAAVRLAEWIGANGRVVTDSGALRPADGPDAARAVGVPVPVRKVRRAADGPEVHRPWLVAVGAGLRILADACQHTTRWPPDDEPFLRAA